MTQSADIKKRNKRIFECSSFDEMVKLMNYQEKINRL